MNSHGPFSSPSPVYERWTPENPGPRQFHTLRRGVHDLYSNRRTPSLSVFSMGKGAV